MLNYLAYNVILKLEYMLKLNITVARRKKNYFVSLNHHKRDTLQILVVIRTAMNLVFMDWEVLIGNLTWFFFVKICSISIPKWHPSSHTFWMITHGAQDGKQHWWLSVFCEWLNLFEWFLR